MSAKDIRTYINSLPTETRIEASTYVWEHYYDIIDLPTKKFVRNVMNLDIVMCHLRNKFPKDTKEGEKPTRKFEGEAEHMKVFQKYIEKLVDKIVSSKYEYSADDDCDDLSELFND